MNCTSPVRTFALLVILSAATTLILHAAEPLILWDGATEEFNFSTLSRTVGNNTYTLNLNAMNKVSADKSYIQIGNESTNAAITITASAANAFGTAGQVTVIMRCSNAPVDAGSNRALIALLDNTKYVDGGAGSDSSAIIGISHWSHNIYYIWKGGYWGDTHSVSGKFTSGINVVALTYSSTDGTAYYINGEQIGYRSDLKSSSFTAPHGIALGGVDTDNSKKYAAMTGMKIDAVAVFTNALSSAEVSQFRFPTVKASELNAQFCSAAEVSLTTTDGTCIIGDTAFNASKVYFNCNGSITILPPAENTTVFDFSGVAGTAAVVYEGALPEIGGGAFTAGKVPTWVTDPEQWTGTIWLKNISGITGSNFLPNNYGNESSTIRLTGVSGWLWTDTSNNTIIPAVELHDGDAGYALRLSNGYGYGGNDSYYTVFSELKGDGTLVGYDKAPYVVLKFLKWNDFAGTLSLTNKIAVFGSPLPSTSEINKSGGEIWVMPGAVVSVPPGKAWHAPNGVKVAGTLSYESISRLSEDTTITLRDGGSVDASGVANAAAYAMCSSSIAKLDGWWHWTVPADANVSKITDVVAAELSGSAIEQHFGGLVTNAVAISVLAEIPANAEGAAMGLCLANGSATNSVYAYANGDGSFTVYYDDKGKTSSSKTSSARDLSHVHIWTLACYYNGGVKLYEDGQEIASDTGIKWTSNPARKPSVGIAVGNDVEGLRPLAGMKVYGVATEAANGDSIYNSAAATYANIIAAAPSLDGIADKEARTAILDNYFKYGITSETAKLNGSSLSFAESAKAISIFGPSALDGDGVTFEIGGIDMSDGTLRLDVSPSISAGNSLSVFGKAELGDRWRRLVVNPGQSSVSLDMGSLADCRFFQIRAELGEMGVGYPVSENPSTGDGGTTERQSHFAAMGVGGPTALFTFSLEGGTATDYGSEYYRTLAFQVEGVTAGAVATLSTNGVVAASAEVGEDGSASFGNVPPLESGTTLSFGVSTANAEGKVTTANLDEKAGVMSYAWGDSVANEVSGGVTNVVTTLANRPFADGMKDSNAAGWYRIPAMAMATNDVVVALYDCRLRGSGDLPNSIDWAESWSGDGGATWTKPHIAVDVPNVWSQTPGKGTNITDPCILYDPGSNRFFAMGITGGGIASSHVNGVSVADVVLYVRGTGASDTWQKWTGGPVENERSVKQMVLDGLAEATGNDTIANENAICSVLEGPGHGFVQRKEVTDGEGKVVMPSGTLVFPMQFFPKIGDYSDSQNFALYSMDGGATWAATALTPTNTPAGKNCHAQEGCVVELDDGTWEYMAKYGGYGSNYDTAYGVSQGDDAREDCRLFFRSKDFKTWVFDGYHPHKSIRSQGSCLWLGEKVKTKNGGTSLYAACFSTWGNYSAGQRRGGLKLFFGRDTSSEAGKPGITWDCGELEIRHEHTTACSYNSMAMLDDWTLGVAFESDGHIYFRKVDLSRLYDSGVLR